MFQADDVVSVALGGGWRVVAHKKTGR